MRTDLITAWYIYEWVEQNFPDIAADWSFEIEDQIKAMAGKVNEMVPGARETAVGQHMVPRIVIDQWSLTDITLFAGGTPTPLSPAPRHVSYFTDANEEAVAEAEKAGYRSRKVDITQLDDLKHLNGSTTGIATGLFHFLPDAAVRQVFANLAEAGYQQMVLTQGTPVAGTEVIDQYKKLGANLHLRYAEQLQAVIPDDWQVEQADPLETVIRNDPDLGSHLTNLPKLLDVFRVVRN